jgi:hypothetical protein
VRSGGPDGSRSGGLCVAGRIVLPARCTLGSAVHSGARAWRPHPVIWPEKRSERVFLFSVGLPFVVIMLFKLLDPRGGIPQGDLRGDDPGYFVPGAVFFLFISALATLAAVGPLRSPEPWGRAWRIMAGLASVALGLVAYLSHQQQFEVGDPRGEPWFWPGILGLFALIGLGFMLLAFRRPQAAK